jgi:hypothetical protein
LGPPTRQTSQRERRCPPNLGFGIQEELLESIETTIVLQPSKSQRQQSPGFGPGLQGLTDGEGLVEKAIRQQQE